MAAVNQFVGRFQQQLALFNRRFSAFFSFVLNRLKNFKNISLQEQIAYGVTGVGIVLMITSIILFVI
jgi:hypothetical protein